MPATTSRCPSDGPIICCYQNLQAPEWVRRHGCELSQARTLLRSDVRVEVEWKIWSPTCRSQSSGGLLPRRSPDMMADDTAETPSSKQLGLRHCRFQTSLEDSWTRSPQGPPPEKARLPDRRAWAEQRSTSGRVGLLLQHGGNALMPSRVGGRALCPTITRLGCARAPDGCTAMYQDTSPHSRGNGCSNSAAALMIDATDRR
ncbi:hypothetical protein LZ30DRAFT_729338 [Colletotrichum cereale]|nr:hypothetical protein LZ30DRAFT_729338 [Colletotrichum cereale]